MSSTVLLLGMLLTAAPNAKATKAPKAAKVAKVVKVSPAARFAAGVKAFKAKDFVKATEELSASNADKPQAKTALYLGNAYLKLDQLGKAKQALELAINLDPKSKKRKAIEKLIEIIDARDVGVLTIGSTPTGASIRIDTEKGSRGKVPMDLSLAPGSHTVIAELEGYAILEQEHLVKSGETATIDFALRPLECALSVTANPPGTKIAIDGAPPIALPRKLQVQYGPHQVALTANAHEPMTQTVTCDGHTPITVEVSLTPIPVAAPVAAEPTEVPAVAEAKPVALEPIDANPSPTKAPAVAEVKVAEVPAASEAKPITLEPTAKPSPNKTPAWAPAQATPEPIAEVAPQPTSGRRWLWVVLGGVVVAGAAGAGVGVYLSQPQDPRPSLGSLPLEPQ